MLERKFDKNLRIRTRGLREWDFPVTQYNRYEATPYSALEELFESYKIRNTDRIVDFGCGRGRVTFYIHDRFEVPVTGIEINDMTFGEALDNQRRYETKSKHIKAPIKFSFGLAQKYEIKPDENVFYFFNPFSVEIFNLVIDNIINSVLEHRREVDIILYYPIPEFKRLMEDRPEFNMISKVDVPDPTDSLDLFMIYRLDPEKLDFGEVSEQE